MRILTGTANSGDSFRFEPLKVDAIGPTVFVEGQDLARNITWVHAWSVTDGIITQVREYFNTSLTVTRLGNQSRAAAATSAFTPLHCPSVWESSLSNRVGKSVPGLVLAI
ncbi:wound-induced protein 1 [Ipomoea triloba]|uniref:wound-induced protein 1 n=1 Tax=Ipomoea triloba TaxID=35885 RepID=UPI0003E6F9BE|nr:wound-induced protein 1 [Ipomoea triloba]GMC65677.1 wound-induced protein 1 [Ipomoea batatas]GMC65678.1 wound-induced protein 1 [Ipomoea batatas]GMD58720.1 wound-induced protein 1 [Ipomoea batatas]